MLFDRRTLLGMLAAAAFGGVARARDMAGGAPAATVGPGAPGPVVTPFTPARHAALDRLVDLVIPTTDTPGAREAGVTGFVELMYEHWMTAEERARCDAELTLAMAAFAKGGDPAAELFLGGRFLAPTLRKLTIYGYYTSEAGASEELDLNLAPGSYDACAPVRPDERAPSLAVWGIQLSLAQAPAA